MQIRRAPGGLETEHSEGRACRPDGVGLWSSLSVVGGDHPLERIGDDPTLTRIEVSGEVPFDASQIQGCAASERSSARGGQMSQASSTVVGIGESFNQPFGLEFIDEAADPAP